MSHLDFYILVMHVTGYLHSIFKEPHKDKKLQLTDYACHKL